jgi:hypothetical protein
VRRLAPRAILLQRDPRVPLGFPPHGLGVGSTSRDGEGERRVDVRDFAEQPRSAFEKLGARAHGCAFDSSWMVAGPSS